MLDCPASFHFLVALSYNITAATDDVSACSLYTAQHSQPSHHCTTNISFVTFRRVPGLNDPRYGDLLAKNCLFSHPTLIHRPHFLCSLWNFVLKLTVNHEKTGVMGLSSSEARIIVAGVVSTCYHPSECDRQTIRRSRSDRRTESFIANIAALQKYRLSAA